MGVGLEKFQRHRRHRVVAENQNVQNARKPQRDCDRRAQKQQKKNQQKSAIASIGYSRDSCEAITPSCRPRAMRHAATKQRQAKSARAQGKIIYASQRGTPKSSVSSPNFFILRTYSIAPPRSSNPNSERKPVSISNPAHKAPAKAAASPPRAPTSAAAFEPENRPPNARARAPPTTFRLKSSTQTSVA